MVSEKNDSLFVKQEKLVVYFTLVFFCMGSVNKMKCLQKHSLYIFFCGMDDSSCGICIRNYYQRPTQCRYSTP